MKLFQILLVVILVFTACTPQAALVSGGKDVRITSQQPLLTTKFSSSITASQDAQFEQQRIAELKQKILNKTPYTGPISIKINTGMLDKKNPNPRVLTLKSSQADFKTQAVPAGVTVFQETFVRNQGQDVVQRAFTVPDSSKFYTLHVQNGDAQGNNETTSAVVNLNGFDWIRANEIKTQIPEVQKDSVLLQANNTLTVTHHGSPGSTFTLTVVEGGQAGTIRRRNGPLNDHPTQAEHSKAFDKNIFDLSSLNNGLGSLKPFEGDIVIPTEGNSSIQFGQMKVNDTDELSFQGGVFKIQLAEPVIDNLFVLDSIYDIAIERMISQDTFLLRFEKDNVPVSRTIELINFYNQGISTNITGIDFSSTTSFKTLIVILDIIKNHHELIQDISLNITAPAPSVQIPNDGYIDNLGNSWWLADSKVFDAWDYTDGTGVTMAFIDDGGFGQISPIHTEMAGRLLLDGPKYRHNQTGGSIRADNIPDLAASTVRSGADLIEHGIIYHGHYNLMVGFAAKNNGTGSAGIASGTKVIPYKALTVSGYTQAVLEANLCKNPIWKSVQDYFPPETSLGTSTKIETLQREEALINQSKTGFHDCSHATEFNTHGIQVLLINKSFHHYTWLDAIFTFASFNSDRISLGGIESLKKEIEKAINAGIVVVAPAQNFSDSVEPKNVLGESAHFWYPANDPKVIGVGAVSVNGALRQLDSEGFAIPGRLGLVVERKSNFGPDLVYAPGDYIPVALHDNATQLGYMRGTCPAASFVAGMASLMKSLDPTLTPAEVKSIIKSTSSIFIDKSSAMINYPGTVGSPKFVDAGAAMAQVAARFAPTVSSIKPNTIDATVEGEFTLKGQHFFSPAIVKIDNASFAPLSINVDRTEIFFELTPNNLSVGTHNVYVQTSGGLSNPVQLNVLQAPFHTGGGGSSGGNNVFTVDVSNIDDLARVYININNLVLEVPYQQEGSVDITPFLSPGANTIRLLVWNYDGGYTWGFNVKQNGTTIFTSTAGIAGVIGANNNDQTKTDQWVYDHTVSISN